MPPHPLLVLPPSAGKAHHGTGPAWPACDHRFADLDTMRRRIRAGVDAQIAAGTQVASLFGVSPAGLPAALRDWADIDTAATLPAHARYTGVVWSAIDPSTLGAAGRRRLHEWVVVVSGMWGLLGADDPIPPYRLPIGARIDGVGGLAAAWRPHLSDTLARHAAGRRVFDLLPDDHAAAIDWTGIRRCRIHLVADAARTRQMGHAGKALKGQVARAILQAGPRTPRALADTEFPGLRVIEAGETAVVLASR